MKLSKNNSVYWQIALKHHFQRLLETHYSKTGEQLTIQGEIVGPNIQKNKYKLDKPELYIFNIIAHNKKYHYSNPEMLNFSRTHGLKVTPGMILPKLRSLEEMIEMAKGYSELNSDQQREGLVVRYIDKGKKELSFKVINNNFLLEEKD